jgi:cell division transport system ATP-binding protein
MITLEQVNKRYPNGHEALSQISFQIESGEMVFLTGHSGAGKSTLLKLIALIDRPTSGQIHVGDKLLNAITPKQTAYYRRRIGIIFQNPKLLDNYTVFENVAIPLIIAGFSRFDIQRRVRAALDRVGLLSKEQLKPIYLSQGEQQRVGIARAVVHKPELLLADEPTGNLDPALSFEIMALFERFHQVGVTVLIATHDIDLLKRFSKHRTLHLEQGKLVQNSRAHKLNQTKPSLATGTSQHG